MVGVTGIEEWTNDVHQGDAAETLAAMPESSVHFAMCSPPYFQQRDYDVAGQIGLEESLEEYIASIVDVGTELRRVLRDDGSWWLNLGDCYAGSGGPGGDWDADVDGTTRRTADPGDANGTRGVGFERKSRMQVPSRVAIALQDAGWIVRQKIPWIKYGTPDPAADRFRTAHELVFHLVQQPTYWHDPTEFEEWGVFEIPPAQSPDAHFAVYPEELCETPIEATAPECVCPACGEPWHFEVDDVPAWERDRDEIERPQLRRALERFDESRLTEDHLEAVRAAGFTDAATGQQQTGAGRNADEVEQLAEEAKDVLGGYFREFTMTVRKVGDPQKPCRCPADRPVPGVVLDPFAGTGTTCAVAKDLGRRFVGVELNPEYVAMAQKKIGVDVDEPELLLEDDETSLAAFADGGEQA